MPILPEEVALSAVALVGTVDVRTLLAARAGQALVHIWRLEVRAHYHQSPIKEFPSLHVNKAMLLNQLCFRQASYIQMKQHAVVNSTCRTPALISCCSGNLCCSRIRERDVKTNTRSFGFSKTYGRLHRHVRTVEDTYTHAGTHIHTHTPSQFLPSPDKRKPEVHEHS